MFSVEPRALASSGSRRHAGHADAPGGFPSTHRSDTTRFRTPLWADADAPVRSPLATLFAASRLRTPRRTMRAHACRSAGTATPAPNTSRVPTHAPSGREHVSPRLVTTPCVALSATTTNKES